MFQQSCFSVAAVATSSKATSITKLLPLPPKRDSIMSRHSYTYRVPLNLKDKSKALLKWIRLVASGDLVANSLWIFSIW